MGAETIDRQTVGADGQGLRPSTVMCEVTWPNNWRWFTADYPLRAGVGLNFDPIEFRPVGSWFNWLCSGFNGFLMLNCDPPRQGVIVLRPLRRIKFGPPLNCDPQVLIPRWIMTPGLDSTLNVDPESWFNIKLWPGWVSQFNVELWPRVIILELWPRVIILRLNVIPSHDSTLNCYPGQDSTLEFDPGSWFHVEKLPRVLIQHWNMTLGLNSTLNCDPESWFNVELWPGLGITIQCGILTRGHNSTWNFDPGSQFNVEFWPRLHIFYPWNCDSRWCQNSTAWSKFNS